jgi:hypothetical protein
VSAFVTHADADYRDDAAKWSCALLDLPGARLRDFCVSLSCFVVLSCALGSICNGTSRERVASAELSLRESIALRDSAALSTLIDIAGEPLVLMDRG